jgi:hypothetical protein
MFDIWMLLTASGVAGTGLSAVPRTVEQSRISTGRGAGRGHLSRPHAHCRSIDQSSVRIAVKQDDPERLFATVLKPTVEADIGEITVSWKTGPTFVDGSYIVSCYEVQDGADPITCKNLEDNEPIAVAEGDYDKTLLKDKYTEVLEYWGDEDEVVQCFIEVEGEYGHEKCKEAGEATFPEVDARLFATVQKPTVEADIGEITVSWKTGPAFVDGSYIVSCYEVLDGADPITCKNLEDNEPIAVAEGDYDKTLLKDEYTEVLLYQGDEDEVVQCFIEVEGEYGHEKCKEAGEATFPEVDARLAGSIIKPTTVATGAGFGEVSFETIGAVEYEYSIQCYNKDDLDAEGAFLTCLPLGGKLDFDDAGIFLIEETDGTTEVGKSTTTWAFGDVLDADKTAQCFIFVEGPYGKLDKCMSAGEAVLEDQAARLFATVQKPTVEADIGEITVSWKTGPAFVDGSYIVSCYEVLDGADPITCKNLEDNEPIAVAEGDYDKTLLKDEYTEVLEYWGDEDEVVQCFIEVEGEYGHEKCKEAGEATFPEVDARLAGSIIKPTTVATGAGFGEVSFETIGAVEYEYSIQCYNKDDLDAEGAFLTCLPLGGKLDFDDAGIFLIEETDGTTEVGKSTTTWAFGDVLDADKTAQCFIFVEGPYGKLDKCMSAGEAVLEDQAARLFATVQKPTVEADAAEITVSWKTGPAFVDGSYTVSCYEVQDGADPITCKNLEDNEPIAVAEGDYDKTLLKDEYTEVLEYVGTDGEIVQCFIEVEGEFGHEKCKEAGEATIEIPAPAP